MRSPDTSLCFHLLLLLFGNQVVVTVQYPFVYSSVYILTNDQDVKLGSLEVQDKVQKLLVQEGMVFENAFVTTPVCCPSR